MHFRNICDNLLSYHGNMFTYHSKMLVHAMKLYFANSLAYMESKTVSQIFITPLTLVWEMTLILMAAM